MLEGGGLWGSEDTGGVRDKGSMGNRSLGTRVILWTRGQGSTGGTGGTGSWAAEGSLGTAGSPGAPGAVSQCGCRRARGGRALVHCRMGLSRSAATVLAYAMKEFGWPLERALRHVRCCRPGVMPNPGFMRQLDFYQGILSARWVGGATNATPTL